MGETIFKCPHCTENLTTEETIDRRYERIQNTDQVIDSYDSKILKELWYCYWCGGYFIVEFQLKEIKPLIKI